MFNRRYNYGLGDAPDPLATEQVSLARALKEAALETAAAQAAVGLIITALCSTVVGAAVGLVLAAVEAVGSVYNDRRMREVVDELKASLNSMSAQYQARYEDAKNKVYAEELANAIQHLKSGQGLSGFTVMPHWFAQPIAHGLVTATTYNGSIALKTVAAGARLVGDKKTENKSIALQNSLSRQNRKAEDAMSAGISNTGQFVKDWQKAGNTLTGFQQVVELKRRAAIIKQKAHDDLEAGYQSQVANLNGQPFRSALRTALINKLSSDPSTMAAVEGQQGGGMGLLAVAAAAALMLLKK